MEGVREHRHRAVECTLVVLANPARRCFWIEFEERASDDVARLETGMRLHPLVPDDQPELRIGDEDTALRLVRQPMGDRRLESFHVDRQIRGHRQRCSLSQRSSARINNSIEPTPSTITRYPVRLLLRSRKCEWTIKA